MIKNCVICGSEFQARDSRHKTCSKECSLANMREKDKEYSHQWRKKNTEKHREYSHQWRKKNPEKYRESDRIQKRKIAIQTAMKQVIKQQENENAAE